MKLKSTFAELVMLLGVFSLGSIAIIASAARLSNIGRWASGDDFTYDAAMVPVWGAVEINVAIVSGKSKFQCLFYINDQNKYRYNVIRQQGQMNSMLILTF